MTITRPEGVRAKGKKSYVVVTDIASAATGEVSLTEINATSSKVISCHVYGQMNFTAEAQKITLPARACDDKEIERTGRTRYGVEDVQYTYDPQGDDTDYVNAAKAALVPETEVWLVERLGKSATSEPFAVGDKVILHHVVPSVQRRTNTGDDDAAEFSLTQSFDYVEGSGPIDAVVAA